MRMTDNKNLGYYKLLKKIGNPNSKMFQDGFANINTDEVNTADLKRRLHEFHEKYYSANLMSLVVIGDVDLKVLKSMIELNFNWVKNKEIERPLYNATATYIPPFEENVFGRIYYMQGFTKPSKLTLTFQCPSSKTDSGFNSLSFISQFINYYSENSLKQSLIKKNLITAFSDSVVLQDYVNSVYIISFALTDEGLKNSSKVINHFFHFLEKLKSIENKQQIYESYSKISKYSFLFGVKSEFIDFSHTDESYFDRASDFSQILLDQDPDKLFIFDHIFINYNETEFKETLNSMTPEKTIYSIESPDFKLEEVIRSDEGENANMIEQSVKLELPNQVVTKSRNLQLKNERRMSRYEDELALNSFFSLQHNGLGLNLKTGRILTEYILDKSTNELTESSSFNEYFDKSTETVTLPFEFDFDNGRRYNHKQISPAELKSIQTHSMELTETYETCRAFDTSFLDHYKMITKCHTPPSLAANTIPEHMALKSIIDFVNIEKNVTHPDLGLETKQIFAGIFNDRTPPLDTNDRLVIIRDLTVYKYCLIREFNNDDRHENAEMVYKSGNLNVFHHLFRKTLQPKSVITIVIESQMIIDSVMTVPYEEKIHKALVMEILCMYLMRHVEFHHRHEYIRGNDFNCKVENYRIVYEFEGFSVELNSFVVKVLTSLQTLIFSQSYQIEIIENYKRRIIDMYSQFSANSSLKRSMFYLNSIMDRIFIDNSNEAKVKEITRKLQTINEFELASILEQVMTSNKLYVMGIGNINEVYVIDVAKQAKDLLVSLSSPSLQTSNMVDFRNYIEQNFVNHIDLNKHIMVRLENVDKNESNSVYLTYFKIGRLDRFTRLQALVMNQFLTKTVYNELRNKLNLGYVAQAGLKLYYTVN